MTSNSEKRTSKRWQPIWSSFSSNQIPSDIVSISDYEDTVRKQLPSPLQALLFENTLIDKDSNLIALDNLRWLPQVLNPQLPDISCHLYNPNSAVVLDLKLPHPLWLSPVAHQALFHPDAELATLEATNLMQTTCIWSCMGNTLFEKLLPLTTSAPKVIQWYWQSYQPSTEMAIDNRFTKTQYDRQHNLDLINDLIIKGLDLLVITVDAPHQGVRSVSRREGAYLPPYCQCVNLPSNPSIKASLTLSQLMVQAPTWEDIEWLIARCKVPVILKGILDPADAKRAQDIGCAGIFVSNHGRRVLSDVVAVADMLPKIREQIDNNMVIIADGGIRSGSDMAKMLALGADSVAIGRSYIYGLALEGALGVAHINKILLEELQVTMAVLGVPNLSSLTKDKLLPQP